jgi:hypothetical protein
MDFRTARIVEEVAAERERQITAEGFTLEHDDAHEDGELLSAGMAYYLHATGRPGQEQEGAIPPGWPWEPAWWKPSTPRRDLVKAGALYLAEKARLARLGACTISVETRLDLVYVEIERIDITAAHAA